MIKRTSALLPAIFLVAACGGATTTAPATSAPAKSVAATATVTPATPAPLSAKAELKDKDGATVATATFTETSAGVKLALSVTKLPAGQHGWHIHSVGTCTVPDFASAGAHFNPDGHQHGAQNPQGPHAGDLGNLTVASDGTVKTEIVNKAVTLESGKPNSLFKDGGTALVIHANADDEKTDPSGNSGGRIACGVVQK